MHFCAIGYAEGVVSRCLNLDWAFTVLLFCYLVLVTVQLCVSLCVLCVCVSVCVLCGHTAGLTILLRAQSLTLVNQVQIICVS